MTMQLPAHLANRQRRDLAGATMGGINSGQPPHLSIKDNRFTLVDGAGNTKPMQTLFLDICIIDANAAVSKIYYDPRTPYDPSGDNNNPPICFSDNGIGASAQASQPQNTSCQLCPHNAWGSAVSKMTGKPVKACNDLKKMAFIVPGDPNQLVYQLRIPPASLKNLAQYTQTVAGHGCDLYDVVTRLEFESQGVLKFSPASFVDEATAKLTEHIWAQNATDILVGKNDRPWTGQALAAPAAQQALPPAQPAPQPFMAPPQPVQQPAAINGPFGGGAPVTAFVPPSPAAAAPPTTPFAAPAAQPEPPKRTRRTKAEVEAEKAAKVASTTPPFMQPAPAAPQTDGGIPPFLQGQQEVAQQPAPAQQNFGMNPEPPAPDAGMQAALDAAFRLPT